jgi:hypothetical protein
MAAHSYGASKKRFAKTRSLHPSDAVQGFGISQQAFCNAKWSLYIRRHCLLRMRTPFELQNDFSVAILGLSKFFREDAAVTARAMQIGNKPCRIYGEAHAEYLLLQMTGEHERQSMDSEITAIAQSAHHFLFTAVPVESWNDALSPWEAPAVWGKQGFGGNAADTLRFLTERVIPTLKQQFRLPENVKIILGGYSLAGLFAL